MHAEYKYDVFGLRNAKVVDSDGDGSVDLAQRYALDGWDVFADLDANSSLTTRYVRGDVVDQLFARLESDGDAFWNYGDHLGSIREITDGSGLVVDALTYDAFGNILSETDPQYRGRYAYTGRELDVETGLQYNRARYYDATTGRWLSQDPLGFEAGDSNLYRYVNNSPTFASDSSGNYLVTRSEQTAKEIQAYLKNGSGPFSQTAGFLEQEKPWNIDTNIFKLPSGLWLVLSDQGQTAKAEVLLNSQLYGNRGMNPAMRVLRSLQMVKWTNEIYWTTKAWKKNTLENASFPYLGSNSYWWLTVEKVDLSSQDMLAAKFLVWYKGEKSAGLGWTKNLPIPPAKLEFRTVTHVWGGGIGACGAGGTWTSKEPILPDGWVWDLAIKVRFLRDKYHPGAEYGIRKKSPFSEAGSQATYDKNGNLIRTGLGAGTADKVSPDWFLAPGFTGPATNMHKHIDVIPFDWAYELDMALGGVVYRKLYIEVRPAVNP